MIYFPPPSPFSWGTKVSGMLGRCYQGADIPTLEQRSSQVDGAGLDCTVPLSVSEMLDHKHMPPQSLPATPHMLTSVPGNLCYSRKELKPEVGKAPAPGEAFLQQAHHSTSSWKHTARGSDDKERTACKAQETECDHRCVELSSSVSYLKHPHTVGRCSNPLTIAEVG